MIKYPLIVLALATQGFSTCSASGNPELYTDLEADSYTETPVQKTAYNSAPSGSYLELVDPAFYNNSDTSRHKINNHKFYKTLLSRCALSALATTSHEGGLSPYFGKGGGLSIWVRR